MAMYNLLEYSDNYSMTSGSLWIYYRDDMNDCADENVNNRINNNKTITSKSFEFKTKLKGSTPDDNNILDAEVVVPLNYLSNFWRSLDLPLINCETEVDLPWSKECIISEISLIPRVPPNPDAKSTCSGSASNTKNKCNISNKQCYTLYSSCHFVYKL